MIIFAKKSVLMMDKLLYVYCFFTLPIVLILQTIGLLLLSVSYLSFIATNVLVFDFAEAKWLYNHLKDEWKDFLNIG